MLRLFVLAVISCLGLAAQTIEPGFVRLLNGALNGWKLDLRKLRFDLHVDGDLIDTVVFHPGFAAMPAADFVQVTVMLTGFDLFAGSQVFPKPSVAGALLTIPQV